MKPNRRLVLAVLCAAACSRAPQGPKLIGADLANGYKADADLRNADLRDADLRNTILWSADLRGADLTGAKLDFANLSAADLRGAKVTAEQLTRCVFEPKLPPAVDAGVALPASRGPSFGRPVLDAGAKRAAARFAGQTIDAKLRLLAPSSTRVFTRLRHLTRIALHEIEQAVPSLHVATVRTADDTDRDADTLLLRIGSVEKRLGVLTDLADVGFTVGAKQPVMTARGFYATDVILRSIQGILTPPPVFLVGGSYARLRRAFGDAGIEVKDADDGTAVLAFLARGETAGAIGKAVAAARSGRRVLLVTSHSADPNGLDVLEALGVRLSDKQLFNGARDPMSGAMTFGSEDDRVLVLEGGFNPKHAVTRGLAQPQTMVELADARALIAAPGKKPIWLMTTERAAWLGEVEGRPKEADLRSFHVAALLEHVGTKDGALAVIAGRAFTDDLIGVSNQNRDLAVALIEWLALR